MMTITEQLTPKSEVEMLLQLVGQAENKRTAENAETQKIYETYVKESRNRINSLKSAIDFLSKELPLLRDSLLQLEKSHQQKMESLRKEVAVAQKSLSDLRQQSNQFASSINEDVGSFQMAHEIRLSSLSTQWNSIMASNHASLGSLKEKVTAANQFAYEKWRH